MKRHQIILTAALFLSLVTGNVLAAQQGGGIDETDKWAWNDVAGWIDFHGPGNGVNVTTAKLKNYGFFYNNSTSYVALDCQTTPSGNICSSVNFYVSNDGTGRLAGWAWNDGYGWISFCGNTGGGSTYNGSTWVCPSSPTHQVTIDSEGYFHGWAWNDTIGWISFNCDNSGIGNTCGISNYKVKTQWGGGTGDGGAGTTSGSLESATFDTGVPGGVVLNAVMWLGTSGVGGTNIVKFQIATANCTGGETNSPTCDTNPGWGGSKTNGDGAFVGGDGTSATYYQPGGPGEPAAVTNLYHNSKRYFRYKLFIEKDASSTTPVVRDVIINWSR